MVAKCAAFPKLTPRNSRKRLGTYLKDLGVVNMTVYMTASVGQAMWPGGSQLGPRQEAAVRYDGL